MKCGCAPVALPALQLGGSQHTVAPSARGDRGMGTTACGGVWLPSSVAAAQVYCCTGAAVCLGVLSWGLHSTGFNFVKVAPSLTFCPVALFLAQRSENG